MNLSPGQRLGPYEVLSKLGEGGMGQVYRARDTRLGRDVAIKVLPALFASDPERLARFTREAQTLAALNHPNIAQIYGVVEGPRDGNGAAANALVMEFADGDDLSTIVARGPIAVADAIAIARQIAEALEAAHEQGIVHRDLKPANVKIRHDGTVKVLDFGLAKAMDPNGAASAGPGYNLANSPTLTAHATQLGVIMGTAAYMAPEQARGKTVDKRADIWAFGVVLFEMMTGRQTFGGDTISEVLAAVMKDEPDWARLPPVVPPSVAALVRRCLVKDPRQRLRDIGEARILLSASPDVPAAMPARASRRLPALGAGAIALALVAGVAGWQIRPTQTVPLRQFTLPPEIAAARDAALAPDGNAVAYIASGRLYVRTLGSLEVRDVAAALPGSGNIFWSPDARSIGFAARGALQTVRADGGPVFTVCAIPASGRVMDAAWLADGTILFAVWRDSLYRVPASGGTPAVFLQLNAATEVDFHAIAPLPDGRLIVQTHQRETDSDVVEIVDGTRRTVLSSDRTAFGFRYGAPGRLLFLRDTINAGLWSAPFSGTTADMNNATLIQADASAYDVARDGTLLEFLPAVSRLSLQWLDGNGGLSPVAGDPIDDLDTSSLAMSPDGRRLAFIIDTGPSANLIVRDLTTGVDTPLTFRKADATHAGTWSSLYSPSWVPGSDRLLHVAGITAALKIVERRADAAGDARELTAGAAALESPDGRTLLVKSDTADGNRLRRVPIVPGGALGQPEPVFHAAAEPNVGQFQLSPDGRLLAYTALDEQKSRSNVYLTDFPGASGQLLIASGGTRPMFSHSNELLYLKGDADAAGRPHGTLMSVRINPGPPITLDSPTRIFDDEDPRRDIEISGYTVTSGGRVLIPKHVPPAPGKEAKFVLVQNWPALLTSHPVK